MLAVIYCRTPPGVESRKGRRGHSTHHQWLQPTHAVSHQEHLCRAYCQRRADEIVGVVTDDAVDAGVPGLETWLARPGARVELVVVATLDLLAPDPPSRQAILNELRGRGLRVESVIDPVS